MSNSAPEHASASSHPDFPNGTEVVNTIPSSRYFNQRGSVYGSGPSKAHPNNKHAVIYVRWADGERYKYFPKSISPAPLRESEYRTSSSNRNGRKVQTHVVLASKRGLPTIFERHALQQSAAK